MSARPILRAGSFCRPAGNAHASFSLALRPWASATTRTFSSSARGAAQNAGSSAQANSSSSSSSSSGSGSSGAIVSSVPPVSPHYIKRHARQAASAERTAALAQRRRESRRDALMELYQAAGKFIVDEAELRQRVEELFRPDYFKEMGYSYGTVGAENIWDVMGKPASLNDMMSGITRTETKLYDSKRTEADRTTKRQKLVAEALTGGKMPL
ncbi:hypothetical protein SPI_08525 [Niveomyces insectorum RCEF 264]|uniref:Uncharacterized protein n=1 Tax=Niveomyces insectorum RCEF 264 TaxID=1081102 RepID=A0A167N1W1_9HYPO|nr:hypothetical protein SPI_08525 [Niveomyces insectorum RCEF 264]